MKLTTPEIVWHGKEPVFSADFHRNGANWRLATGGADNDIKIWKLVVEEERMKVVFMSNLSRHTKAVNVVRFSPNGELLASAGDDGVVCIWKMNEVAAGGNMVADEGLVNKENWTVTKTLRGHLEDIYDLCWSVDSSFIITGSVDNSAIVWDVAKGQQLSMLNESKQYVQGVVWDPVGQYVVTLSSDRNLRVYSTELKFKCIQTVSKFSVADQNGGMKQFRMWIDEGLSSFFRRMSYTPDGSLLIIPAGRFEGPEKAKNCTYVFTRNSLSKPVLQLPAPEKPTVAVRCCPVLFELLRSSEGEDPKPSSLFSLPYRMVYAVASLDSMLFYDTQHVVPFAYISNIHYAGITDLTWSNDGCTLVVTSLDGYCTIVSFDPGELGTPLDREKLPPLVAKQLQPVAREQTSVKSPSLVKESKVNSVKPRRIHPTVITSPNDKNGETPSLTSCSSTSLPQSKDNAPDSAEMSSKRDKSTSGGNTSARASTSARRVNLITLSSNNDDDRHKTPSLTTNNEVSSCTNPDKSASPGNQGARRVNFITLSSFLPTNPNAPKCGDGEAIPTSGTSAETSQIHKGQGDNGKSDGNSQIHEGHAIPTSGTSSETSQLHEGHGESDGTSQLHEGHGESDGTSQLHEGHGESDGTTSEEPMEVQIIE